MVGCVALVVVWLFVVCCLLLRVACCSLVVWLFVDSCCVCWCVCLLLFIGVMDLEVVLVFVVCWLVFVCVCCCLASVVRLMCGFLSLKKIIVCCLFVLCLLFVGE